jgi:D-sedoheptulose 7-phosphate isomerase
MDVNHYFDEVIATLLSLDRKLITQILEKLSVILKDGNTLFVAGNGGSGATASHFVNDMVKGFSLKHQLPISVVSLSDNTPTLTAIANDLSFEEVFSFQLSGLARDGDALLVISGSGNSENLVRAVKRAKELSLQTFGLLGFDGGKLLHECEYSIHVDSYNMQIVEDIHGMFGHLLLKHN